MNYTLAKEIYGQPWYVDAITLQSLNALLSHFKQGGSVTPGEKNNDTFLYDIKNETHVTRNVFTAQNDNSENKHIAVTKIDGPITKNGGESTFGTVQMGERFKKFDKLSNVIGHILHIDSGGGASNAVKYMRDVALQTNKPVVGFGEDTIASAAFYIISAADHIIVNSNEALVGSIGTMIELSGRPKVAEDKQTGERFVRIYADKATQKNKEFEEAINNLNFTPIKDNILNPHNEKFILDVIESRENVKESQLKGDLFKASEVVGSLIDGIGTFEDAVNKVIELSSNSKPNSGININKNQKIMTQSEIKAQHPEVYNAIVTEGITAERSRVNAILKFSSIDMEACLKMVAEGKTPDVEFFADMQVKAISAKTLDGIKDESQGTVKTAEEIAAEVVTKEELEAKKFTDDAKASAGLKVEEVIA